MRDNDSERRKKKKFRLFGGRRHKDQKHVQEHFEPSPPMGAPRNDGPQDDVSYGYENYDTPSQQGVPEEPAQNPYQYNSAASMGEMNYGGGGHTTAEQSRGAYSMPNPNANDQRDYVMPAGGGGGLQNMIQIQFDEDVAPPEGFSPSQRNLVANVPTKSSRPRFRTAWISRTRWFQKMCDWAFNVVDADGSGFVDEKELYSGLLLIHLKLGSYAGPAACRPLSREKCSAIFHKMDVDESGTLDQDEFMDVMQVLFGNVILRVLFQWSMTIMIVPLVAKALLDTIAASFSTLWGLWERFSPLSRLVNMAGDRIEDVLEYYWDRTLLQSPKYIQAAVGFGSFVCEKIPDKIWDSIPLTLMSTVLGLALVPWCIYQIDEYFQGVALKKGEKKLAERR